MKIQMQACVALVLAARLAGAQAAAAAPNGAQGADASSIKCRTELSPEALDRAAAKSVEPSPAVDPALPRDPVGQLQLIAREALKRSAAVGANQWLAEAASYDLAQTDAARWPTVSVGGAGGVQSSVINGSSSGNTKQLSMSVTASANLYDGGRLKGLIQWRKDLERAGRYNFEQARESVIAEAVGTVLDRSRYQQQAQVYQQYVRKMSCLVQALDVIVSADKGRASEQVQARKTLAQAELSRDVALAASRQIDLKLRRLLGDRFVAAFNITSPLASTPDAGEMLRLLEQSPDARQLQAQAQAQESYAQALDAGSGPQVNWSVGRTQARSGTNDASGWQAGVTLNYTLFDAGAVKSSIQAALARSEAARQQYTDFIATRTQRISELHDVATTAFEHARRYVDILRDSDLVRQYTFQQWSQLGRRSLFDLMSAESEHFNLRVAYVNSLYDGYSANAQLRSLGGGLAPWLLPDVPR